VAFAAATKPSNESPIVGATPPFAVPRLFLFRVLGRRNRRTLQHGVRGVTPVHAFEGAVLVAVLVRDGGRVTRKYRLLK
jgi:hypothetical protein